MERSPYASVSGGQLADRAPASTELDDSLGFIFRIPRKDSSSDR
jgi:hypothetical protein